PAPDPAVLTMASPASLIDAVPTGLEPGIVLDDQSRALLAEYDIPTVSWFQPERLRCPILTIITIIPTRRQ
ncbi:hypothetical protein, partial [Sphingomonas koreensis]|uniref:hypothetical protein n=1 Tax=Sphingomonas koreensis TaxID=93064 RepID=UPI0019CF9403